MMPLTSTEGCPRFAPAYLGRICSFRTLLVDLWMALAGKIVKRLKGFARISCAVCDFDALHAAFLKESRTRGPVECSVQEIRVAPSFSAHVHWGERGASVHLHWPQFDWKIPAWRDQ